MNLLCEKRSPRESGWGEIAQKTKIPKSSPGMQKCEDQKLQAKKKGEKVTNQINASRSRPA